MAIRNCIHNLQQPTCKAWKHVQQTGAERTWLCRAPSWEPVWTKKSLSGPIYPLITSVAQGTPTATVRGDWGLWARLRARCQKLPNQQSLRPDDSPRFGNCSFGRDASILHQMLGIVEIYFLEDHIQATILELVAHMQRWWAYHPITNIMWGQKNQKSEGYGHKGPYHPKECQSHSCVTTGVMSQSHCTIATARGLSWRILEAGASLKQVFKFTTMEWGELSYLQMKHLQQKYAVQVEHPETRRRPSYARAVRTAKDMQLKPNMSAGK